MIIIAQQGNSKFQNRKIEFLRAFLPSPQNQSMRTDNFTHPDYYLVDELLTEEQKLIRDSVRSWVKKEVTPIIEDYAQRGEFPKQLISGLAELGCFGPTIPHEY